MNHINYMDPSDPKYSYLQDMKFSQNSKVFCSAATVRIAIAADGNVYPCVYGYGFEEFIGGNIKTQNITNIWETPKWDIFRGDITVSQLSKCNSCSLLDSCSLKLCRLRSKVNTGDLYGIPHNCSKSPHIVRK